MCKDSFIMPTLNNVQLTRYKNYINIFEDLE